MTPRTDSPATTLAYFRERTGDILEVLDGLVRLESPSGNAEAVARFIQTYQILLEEAGLQCEEIPGENGPILHGRLARAGDAGAPVLLVGHADTVWPVGEVARRPPRLHDGCYHAPGAYDMKAGLAVALFVLRFLRDSRKTFSRPLEVLLSPDEELGSRTAHAYMQRALRPASIALVLEPPLPDGSLKTRRKGVGMYRLEVGGREAHAGNEPEAGVNAIHEIARKILEVASWADPGKGITVNVGEVRGGLATNVIPGRAEAGIDTRFDALADGEEVDRRLRALRPDDPRATLQLHGGIIFPPLVPDEKSARLAALAVEAAGELGLEIGTGRAGGGSDGSFLSSLGLSVLDGLGVDGGGAHSREEHITVEMIPVRAALLVRLLRALESREI